MQTATAAGLCQTLSGASEIFMNKRSRSPTFYGWLLIIGLAFLFAHIYYRESRGASLNKDELMRGDIARFQGRKNRVGPHPFEPIVDLQEAEYKAIDANNMKGKGLKVPVFDPNKHENEAHRREDEKQVKRFGMPQPKDYPVNLLLKPKIECENAEILLMVIVQTKPTATGFRSAIRKTWGRQDADRHGIDSPRWVTIFAMGKSGTRFDEEVIEENEKHGDILQGEFFDTPFEDTRKMMMSMEWITSNYEKCKPKFIMKSQANIFMNMMTIIPWIEYLYLDKTGVYTGRLIRNDKPMRDPTDPHHVPESDFAHHTFPDMIKGPVYMFSEDVFTKMAQMMLKTTPIALEDAYVAILAEKLKITPKHNDHFQMISRPANLCHHLSLFFIFDIKPFDHIEIQHKIDNAKKHPDCLNMEVVDRKGYNSRNRKGPGDLR